MRRLSLSLLSAVLVLSLFPAGALAQPETDVGRERQEGLGAEGTGPRPGDDGGTARIESRRQLGGGGPGGGHSGTIPDPPVEENVDLPPGLIPYHEIAARLRDLDARSDRVSVEVYGQSAGGRDLYLVTVAEPRPGGIGRELRLRDLMTREPDRARELLQRNPGLRSPLWVHGSIHGNEWEGVDASLELIERLAFGTDADTEAILDHSIVLFNVVANPDGRVLGTRRNANDFDLNRDFITRSQPETRAVVEQFTKWNPLSLFDLHGYVNPMLLEPTTPPHNPNYEYDLYIKWALPEAKAMEGGVVALNEPDLVTPDIPFEDYDFGWDDWPPIFTPMYAMYHGSIGHTMEAPLRVNNASVSLPPEERERRSRLNQAAHVAAVWEAFRFVAQNEDAMALDQVEVFQRGDAALPPASDPFVNAYEGDFEWPADDSGFIAQPPGAYVIPVGDGQRSEAAAVRLVNHLLANGIEVRRSALPVRVGSTVYPRGSYVVDMAQARRGLANTMLEPGYDISAIVPVMYDISGWSHGLLWGATVTPSPEPVRAVGPLLRHPVERDVRLRPAAAYALDLTDPSAVRATNALLDLGIALQRAPDGTVVVPGSARSDLEKVAGTEGLDVASLQSVPGGTVPLVAPRIAAAIAGDEYFVLNELGFDVERVDPGALPADLGAFDVLMVSSGLEFADLPPASQDAIRAFLDAGGGVVTRGETGAEFNAAAGVLPVGYTAGPGDANGIGIVEHPGDSPVTAGYEATSHTFVYAPLWFTDLGPGVRVDERFADGDFFISGHWPTEGDEPAQEAAAGQPVVVSGDTAGGGRAVLFGTEPLFRDHPKQLYGQMAQALYWTAGE